MPASKNVRKVFLSVQSWWAFRKCHRWECIPLSLPLFWTLWERKACPLLLPWARYKGLYPASLPRYHVFTASRAYSSPTSCKHFWFKQFSISGLHSAGYLQINRAQSSLQAAAIASPVRNHLGTESSLLGVGTDLADLAPRGLWIPLGLGNAFLSLEHLLMTSSSAYQILHGSYFTVHFSKCYVVKTFPLKQFFLPVHYILHQRTQALGSDLASVIPSEDTKNNKWRHNCDKFKR